VAETRLSSKAVTFIAQATSTAEEPLILLRRSSDRESTVNLFASSYTHLYSSVLSTDDEMRMIHNQFDDDLRKHNNINSAFIISINDIMDSVNGLRSAKKHDMLTSDYFIHADLIVYIYTSLC
jgi:hypothetical protein